MKSLLFYLAQVIICSGILYGYYHFFLRNKKFHLYNRYYLLTATCISIIIPFLNIPVYFSTAQREHSVILQTLTIGSAGKPIYIISSPSLFTSENIFTAFYCIIGLFIFIRFMIAVFQIKRLISKYVVERIDHIYFINTEEEGTPFSFFKWLFWNKKIELDSAEGNQIFRHELFHIEQKHSWDIFFFEMIFCIFWINPFFFFMKKELRTIHEFLADEFAVNEDDKWNYAELLLTQLLGSPNRLVNSFFHNQIKRRIAMITLSKKPGYQYLRKIMVLPIAVIIIFLFAFTYKTRQVLLHQSNRANTDMLEPVTGNISLHSVSKNPNTVFIDSAHFKDRSGKPVHLSNVSVKGLDNVKKDTSNPLDNVLIIIDGKKYSSSAEAFKTINPNDIVSINVLKDSAAIAKFGEKGKNGVIEISTKKHFVIPDTVKGTVSRIEAYDKNGNLIYNSSDKDTLNLNASKILFERAEKDPSFPGGEAAWRKFLEKNLKASVASEHGAHDGSYTVWMQFIVDEEGDLSDIKALTNHGFGMEEECLRLMKQSPKWIPAMQNGHVVKAYKKQPITFVIESQ